MDIREIVSTVVNEHSNHIASGDTMLIGPLGALDSIGLVSVIVELEDALSEMGYDIDFTGESTSIIESSPFKTINTITQFVNDSIDNRGQ